MRDTMSVDWTEAYKCYFMAFQDKDILLSGRWVLENLGLYDAHSGITNNAR